MLNACSNSDKNEPNVKSNINSNKENKIIQSEENSEVSKPIQNDTTRNLKRELPVESFYFSKNIKDSLPNFKKGFKTVIGTIQDVEFTDTSGILNNYQEINFEHIKVEIQYFNEIISEFKINNKKFRIIDSPFMETNINDFTMDLNFVNSKIFKPISTIDFYVIQICPPDWTGRMMQFRLYYLINLKEKTLRRFIA